MNEEEDEDEENLEDIKHQLEEVLGKEKVEMKEKQFR